MDSPRCNGEDPVTGQLLPGPKVKRFMRLMGPTTRLSAIPMFTFVPETPSFAAKVYHCSPRPPLIPSLSCVRLDFIYVSGLEPIIIFALCPSRSFCRPHIHSVY